MAPTSSAPKPTPKSGSTNEAQAPEGPTHARETRANKQRPTRRMPDDEAAPSDTPNMDAQRDWDRAQHVKAAMGMGATKEQAKRHAREEVHED